MTKLDLKAGRQRPWRINLFDFYLLCREIKQLENKEVSARKSSVTGRNNGRSPVHSRSSAELQNICNERDASFAKLRETFIDEDSERKIGMIL